MCTQTFGSDTKEVQSAVYCTCCCPAAAEGLVPADKVGTAAQRVGDWCWACPLCSGPSAQKCFGSVLLSRPLVRERGKLTGIFPRNDWNFPTSTLKQYLKG